MYEIHLLLPSNRIDRAEAAIRALRPSAELRQESAAAYNQAPLDSHAVTSARC
jgi:hypothetical protein